MERDLALLFKKLISNECSPDELSEVLDRLLKNEQDNGDKLIREQLAQKITANEISSDVLEKLDRNLKIILANDPSDQIVQLTKRKIYNMVRYAAAACVVLSISIGVYLYTKRPAERLNIVRQAVPQPDLLPGGNKAILTLANGHQIILTDAKNGKLAQQGATAVNKMSDGQVVYATDGFKATERNTEIAYNTMSTPRGGQYHVVLADGTNVWLNAASSITYPTAFTGADRTVAITGEAYFEVAHNAAKPFRVKSNGQTVEVLGTHFNINAYDDEPAMMTTLFEGAVKVSKGTASAMLNPGQQSVVKENSNNITVTDNDDPDQALAWKNGKFSFNETNIREVMRQVARWYDVDVEYNGQIPNKRLTGTFYRNMNASKALSLLEYTGINFKIEGRKIIVK